MDAADKSVKKHISLVLRIAIAFLACWFLYKKIDPAQVAEAFTQLRVSTLLLAILFFCIGLCLIGFRWWIFMRAQKIHVSVFLAIKLTFLGQFFTNFMPSAVGGDLIRAWYISRHTDKKLQAAIGVAADRFMGLAGTLILASSSYLLFMRGQEGFFQLEKQEAPLNAFFQNLEISWYWILFSAIFVVGVLILLAGFFNFRGLFQKFLGLFGHFIHQTYKVFLVYIHHPLILISGLAISIFMQVLVIFSFWLIGQDLGISAPIQYYFVFFPTIWIIGAIPISIAGIGILEGGLVYLFVQFAGASKGSVLALALCQRLTWIIASMPGLAVHLTGMHRLKESES